MLLYCTRERAHTQLDFCPCVYSKMPYSLLPGNKFAKYAELSIL